MVKILSVKTWPKWLLEVVFADGTRCTVPMKERLFGPVFEPLRDPNLFSQATVDEFGAICWPNGADLAPDAIYEDAVPDASRR
jgi:hypothetical protein